MTIYHHQFINELLSDDLKTFLWNLEFPFGRRALVHILCDHPNEPFLFNFSNKLKEITKTVAEGISFLTVDTKYFKSENHKSKFNFTKKNLQPCYILPTEWVDNDNYMQILKSNF